MLTHPAPRTPAEILRDRVTRGGPQSKKSTEFRVSRNETVGEPAEIVYTLFVGGRNREFSMAWARAVGLPRDVRYCRDSAELCSWRHPMVFWLGDDPPADVVEQVRAANGLLLMRCNDLAACRG